MMRRAARTDANQKEIVEALRAVGASVAITSSVGQGFPDLVIGFRGYNYLIEIKDGSKPPSKRRLTKDEKGFHRSWNGNVKVVNNVEEALKIIGAEYDL